MVFLREGSGEPQTEGDISAGPCKMSGLPLDEGRAGWENPRDALPVATPLRRQPSGALPCKVRNRTGRKPDEASKLPSHTAFSYSIHPSRRQGKELDGGAAHSLNVTKQTEHQS